MPNIMKKKNSQALPLGLIILKKKRNSKPDTRNALLLVIGLVGAFFGIFA